MARSYVLILALFCLFAGKAESQTYVLSFAFNGRVIDSATLSPLPYTYLYLEEQMDGVVSDAEGYFSFRTHTLPVIVKFSHLGYTPRTLTLAEPGNNLSIILKPSEFSLSGVEIKADYIETVFQDRRYSVLDYETDGTNLYVLIYRYRFFRVELIYLSPDGDTLAVSGRLPGKPTEIVRDCLGYFHLRNAEESWQVKRDGRKLSLFANTTRKAYDEAFGGCMTQFGDYVYVVRTSFFGFIQDFYLINKESKSHRLFAKVTDKERINLLQKNPDDLLALAHGNEREDAIKAIAASPEDVTTMRDLFKASSFAKHILYKPYDPELGLLDNLLYVYDRSGNRLKFFSPAGSPLRELSLIPGMKIKPHKVGSLLPDPATGRLYITLLKNSHYFLYEVDIYTGKLRELNEVKLLYPLKFRMMNGWLYFTYREIVVDENRKLMRMKIGK